MMPPIEESQENRRWVRSHVIAYFAIGGVAVGLLIVNAKTAEIVGQSTMPGFRAVLFISVMTAGLGARALLAWRSATVDRQGRVFLVLLGLLLLTGAAFGFSDCYQEVREHYENSRERKTSAETWFFRYLLSADAGHFQADGSAAVSNPSEQLWFRLAVRRDQPAGSLHKHFCRST